MRLQVEILESRKAKKDLSKAPKSIVRAYEIWARLLEIHGLSVLINFPGYRDEKLLGEWKGYRSSRLSRQWRVIYGFDSSKEVEVLTVERVTAHDYRRKK